MIKISAVNYLNATPFIFGIKNSKHLKKYEIELSLDIPSECANKLINGDVDMGLIPIASIPKISNAKLFSNYCIGANGKVGSVLLFSNVPLEKIEKIYLDYQSMTSISLIKIIYHKWLNFNPLWINSGPGYEDLIKGNTGGVIIGDRALQLKNKFKYSYDLSELWKQYTNLPFVFATWVAKESVQTEFLENFENALKWGLKNKHLLKHNVDYSIDIDSYLNKDIKYKLDKNHKKAMNLFLTLLEEQRIKNTN